MGYGKIKWVNVKKSPNYLHVNDELLSLICAEGGLPCE